MGSKHPPGYYDEESLKTVEEAFRDIWNIFLTRNPSPTDRDLLRVAAVDRLLGLVGEGITDPDTLRALTLSHFSNQPPPKAIRRAGK